MDSSIIFEKKYSQFIQECCNNIPAADQVLSAAAITGGDSSAYFRNLLEQAVCILIPERVETRNYFIELAKEIAEAYLIDIVIEERKDRITVTYTLDCDAGFSCLKPLIQLADDLSFQNGADSILILLDYYTHAMYRNGIRISPDED